MPDPTTCAACGEPVDTARWMELPAPRGEPWLLCADCAPRGTNCPECSQPIRVGADSDGGSAYTPLRPARAGEALCGVCGGADPDFVSAFRDRIAAPPPAAKPPRDKATTKPDPFPTLEGRALALLTHLTWDEPPDDGREILRGYLGYPNWSRRGDYEAILAALQETDATARAEEREAAAQVALSRCGPPTGTYLDIRGRTAWDIADAIRARGEELAAARAGGARDVEDIS